jgi:hypothetical protein
MNAPMERQLAPEAQPDKEAMTAADTALQRMMLANPGNQRPMKQMAAPVSASGKSQERVGAPPALPPPPASELPPVGRVNPKYLMDPRQRKMAETVQEPNRRFSTAATATDPNSPAAQFFRLQAQAAMGDPHAALQLQALMAEDKDAR